MTTLARMRFPARFAFGDDSAQPVAVHHDAGEHRVEHEVHAALQEHLQRDGLDRFGFDEREAHVERAGPVFAGGALGPQPVDELLRQAGDDGLAFLAEESEHRQADGQVAADEAAAFDQGHLQAVSRRRPSRR